MHAEEPITEPPEEPAAPTGHALPVAPDIVEQDHPEEMDYGVPSAGYQRQPVVGLGGSAGGIPALQKFFSTMPVDSGLSFVVVIHLAPEGGSILDSILANSTSMPVLQARDGLRLEANSVYVIPPGKFLSLSDDHLRLVPMEHERGRRLTVDLLFRTLADTHGPHAAAIVLSGADGDGALGMRRIKERGGLTVVQEPSEAQHLGMPQSAIDTGMVDWVLPVEEMPERLIEYFANESRLRLPPEKGPELPKHAASPTSDEGALKEILTFLRIRTARDFSCYKRATVVRRISRRMQVNSTSTMGDYLAYLRTHPGEAGALRQDLLISVTNFFRDREAWEAVEQTIIPELFAGKSAGDAVRVWSVACATGEEAFSLGMLLLEQADRMDSPPTVQVFATDLAEEAIIAAREGIFPFTIEADVSEERLRRFFTKEPRGYRVRRDLRECVLFAVHDVLKDAPFSRLELITCRNLLIYLNQDAQKHILNTFQFALNPQGRIFLGSSESVDEESAQWVTLDKKHRLFRRNALVKPLAVPLGPDTLARAVHAQEAALSGPLLHAAAFSAKAALAVQRSLPPGGDQISWEELHFKLIERFSPPSIVVTRDYDIVHVSQNAGRLLQFTTGEPSVNLLQVINPMLRIELRAALFRAAQVNSPVEVFRIPMAMDGHTESVNIRVCPAQDIAPDYLLVVFEIKEGAEVDLKAVQADEPAVRHLERENEQLKRRLRDVIEQYEASGEELKAGNEELQAMNEELRSSAEELETSREELQSINEELTTVNHELKSKVDELGKANSDFSNLMAATGVATIFLDRSLRITRYTPAAMNVFNLIPTDLGRPINHVTHRLQYAEMITDAEGVLDSLIPCQREVTDGDQWFLSQLLPYRTTEDKIIGVVLTFVDITESKKSQEALAESEQQLRLVLENVREYAIVSLDLERQIRSWNSGAERLLGYTEQEIMGKVADIIFTLEDQEAGVPAQEVETALREGRSSDERWHVRKDGTRFWGSGAMMSMQDDAGHSIGLVKVFADFTERRQAQSALEKNQTELRDALAYTEQARALAEEATRAKDRFLAMLSHELRTPLTPVMLGLGILNDMGDLPPRAVESLAMIGRNVERERRLIDELLDVSRITHGKLDIMPVAADLHQVIREAVEISQPEIQGRKQQVELELKATKFAFSFDADRMRQVFWNLLKNACKFSPEGGTIRLASWNQAGKIGVEVVDSGTGFAPEAAERIFGAFHQSGDPEGGKHEGLGLGLAIAKAIVEAHGGRISAFSEGLNQGASFTLELPLRKGA